MAIPDFQTLMRPLLEVCELGKEYSDSEIAKKLAPRFSLTEEDFLKRHDKSNTLIFQGRISWAKVYLQKAGLLESKSRGHFSINDEGGKFLKTHDEINNKILSTVPKFRDWKYSKDDNISDRDSSSILNKFELESDPEESMEAAYKIIRRSLKDKLLAKILEQDSRFFEKLVLDLILALGYGDSFSSGEILGKSSDGGVDGVIKQDRLGLDLIYLQAKRWKDNIGAPEIRDFVGSLVGKQSSKGIFITTSKFTREAIEFASKVQHSVILIDSDKLTDLMIDYGVGVSKKFIYEIKDLDLDYFEGE
ncbi:MAG: restriction endonuclease [Vampirovibrionia bacterium]|jgi:restriction system protein